MSDDDNTTPDTESIEGAEIDPPTEGAEIDKPTDGDTRNDIIGQRRVWTVPVVPLALVLSLLAAGGLAGWLYFTEYRPDTQTDGRVEVSAVNAARDGTVALLSYKPDTLKENLDAARSRLGGDFLHYYDDFSKRVITPAAESKGVATAAQVMGAAAMELHPNSAVVLVFVNQVTTSKERPDPSMAASSVLVSLSGQHGNWLITKFDPV